MLVLNAQEILCGEIQKHLTTTIMCDSSLILRPAVSSSQVLQMEGSTWESLLQNSSSVRDLYVPVFDTLL